MLRTMHSFIFSKLRIITHHNLFAFETRYETNYKELALTQMQQILALEARIRELELALTSRLTALESHYQQLERIQAQKIASLESSYNELLVAKFADLQRQATVQGAIQESLTSAIGLNCRSIGQLLINKETELNSPYLQSTLTIEEQLHKLNQLEPNAFDLWWQCFLNGKKEYERTIEYNLSYGVHPGASQFGDFIAPHLQGNILDVGCGPQLIPLYLQSTVNNPNTRLFAIDPLYAEHPFEFYHGFAEFLPWQANCFDVIICATSMDHFLSLTRSLEEISRVLKAGGKYLVWVGFVSGTKAYNPKANELSAVDDYHLFHFDRPWFESLMANYFNTIEFIDTGNHGWFYIFGKT